MRGLIELCKALARFLVVALVAVVVLRKQFHSFSGLGAEPAAAAIGARAVAGRHGADRAGRRAGGDRR